MLKEERHKNIIKTIYSEGFVSIDLLCRLFKVTEMTIRRDLDELASKNMLVRVHGGATLKDSDAITESPYEVRFSENVKQKKSIANLALDYIKDNQKIFIDSGTTTFILAKSIDNSRRNPIVTNAINVASELNSRTNISIISIGGELKKRTYSTTGFFAENMIKQIKVDIAFIGVSGIGYNGDMYVYNVGELGIKKAIIESSKDVIILCDSSKIGNEKFIAFSNLKETKALITDMDAPSNLQNIFRNSSFDIKIAKDFEN